MNIKQKTLEVWDVNKKDIEKRVTEWATSINMRTNRYLEAKEKFREWAPLRFYGSISRFKKSGSPTFSVRYLGQDIGEITVSGDEVSLTVKVKTINKYFPGIQLESLKEGQAYEWRGTEARKFRAEFKRHFDENENNPENIITKSDEHKIESMLIKEMSKESSNKFRGQFRDIQPVLINNLPFQMAVPLSSNTGVPEYKHSASGNIDILARRTCSDNITRLSVWELKAPGKMDNCVDQGYIYAVSLIKMLNMQEVGNQWHKLFGFKRDLEQTKEVEVVVAITHDQKSEYEKQIALYIQSPDMLEVEGYKIRMSVAYYDPSSYNLSSDNFHEVIT